MTLHNTATLLKKGSIAGVIGLGVIIVLVIFFRIGVVIKDILNPPKIEPANQAYGKLPYLEFPQSTVDQNLTYTIDTLTGTLPEFPDRLIVYPVVKKTPGLLDLEIAQKKLDALSFLDLSGNSLPAIRQAGSNYEWTETSGLKRKLVMDVVSQNLTMTSAYLTSLIVESGRAITNEEDAIKTAKSYLEDIDAFDKDIDINKTLKPDPKLKYLTKPQLFLISNGELAKSTSLSRTKIIRVDFYQKDVEYILTAGKGNNLASFEDFKLKLPILYPNPPYSTMNHLVGTSNNGLEVLSAMHTHQDINFDPRVEEGIELPPATYPIKSTTEAYDELTNGQGYIAAYSGSASQILINNVYLGYYLGEKQQDYLMPIVVFEGPQGFFAYVSAVRDEALE